jgi:hypothetical protein
MVAACACAVFAGLLTGQVASAEVPQTIPGIPVGWGVNSLGAFGAPTGSGPAPVQVTGEAGTTQVSMGCSHALYLHSDGTVWASGWNTWGQLGDGNSTNTTTATQVAGLTSVIAVAAGCYHSVALKADGTVWTWGQVQGVPTSNPPDGTCPGFGGGVPCFLHPTQWLGPSGITQIAAGTLDEVALASDGTVYTGGQIGNAHLTLPDPVTDVAMQDYAAEAITTTGQVYSWGTSNPSPALVPGITGFATALGGGMLSGYAVTSDGTVWAWGDDRYGQLGDGKTTSEPTAIKVPGLPPIVAVAAGFWHAVALDASGNVWAWGDNVDGEVGPQQPQAVEAAPSEVPGIGKALAITAGGYSTIALTQGKDQAITATGGISVTGTESAAVSGTLASFTDPDPAARAAEYAASVSWGDGTSTAGTISGPTGGPFTVTGSHAYGDEGSYPITVTITDTGNTANSATVNDTAAIGDASLSASGISPLPVSGQSFSGPVADFTDADTATSSPADFTATIDWGDGTTATAGTVTGSGGSYQVSGSHSYTGTGDYTVAVHITDDGGSTADAQTKVLIYAVAQGGSFVIGDGNAAAGNAVTFWGAQWHKLNTLTGGPAPASFKGFEDQPAQAACGQAWTTDPGNSTPPPSGSLPAYMAVIVSSSITKSGSAISGNTPGMVVVKTNGGYAPDPGHPGTGTVIAKIC